MSLESTVAQAHQLQILSQILRTITNKSDSFYTIEDLVSSLQTSPLNCDPVRTNPLTAAQHNEQEIIVEMILGHRGDRHRRSTLEFNVRWFGFHACG